jgi:hypothetical protein
MPSGPVLLATYLLACPPFIVPTRLDVLVVATSGMAGCCKGVERRKSVTEGWQSKRTKIWCHRREKVEQLCVYLKLRGMGRFSLDP